VSVSLWYWRTDTLFFVAKPGYAYKAL
jgi:hypothetical protein